MKTLLSSCLILMSIVGTAQITIVDTDFPTAADTAMVSSSDETSLDLVLTGADVVWDFSWVNISAQAIDTFHSVQDASILYQLIFNNSWDNPDHISDYYTPWSGGGLDQLGQFGLGVELPVQFTAVLPDRVQNTGIGFEVMGTGIPGKSDTIDVQYELPMNYSDSWVSNSYTNIDLNPTFDAIYRRYQYRNSIVDGWGEITTPFGTFEALRVKSLVSAVDSFYVGFISSWVELPTPDQIEYDWFATGQKVPVFSVVTTDIGGNETITSIKFKDKHRTFASTAELDFEGKVYPNPATDVVTVSSPDFIHEIGVYSLSGELLFTKTVNAYSSNLELSQLAAGLYVLKVSSDTGIATTKISVR